MFSAGISQEQLNKFVEIHYEELSAGWVVVRVVRLSALLMIVIWHGRSV